MHFSKWMVKKGSGKTAKDKIYYEIEGTGSSGCP